MEQIVFLFLPAVTAFAASSKNILNSFIINDFVQIA